MTDVNILELKRAVERIIRPIRAGWRRKLAMREELLSHIIASYDEVRVGDVSDVAAVDIAIRRLGDPIAVRREYQSSVPFFERVSLRKVGGARGRVSGWGTRGPRETQLHHLVRVASMHGVLSAIAGAAWVAVVAGAADIEFGATRTLAETGLAIVGFAILSAIYAAFAHRILPGLIDRMYGVGVAARTGYGLLGAVLMLIPGALSTFPIVILLLPVALWESPFITGSILYGTTGMFFAALGYQVFPSRVTEWERLKLED